MLMKFVKNELEESNGGTYELQDSFIANIDNDGEGNYTAYFQPKDGVTYYFTFTREELDLFRKVE